MKIDSSVINMSSYRHYSAEAQETQTTVIRNYNGNAMESASVNVSEYKISQKEIEGSSAVYTTTSAGVEKTDKPQTEYKYQETKPVEAAGNKNRQPGLIPMPQTNWLKDCKSKIEDDPEIKLLKKMLQLLKKFRGKDGENYNPDIAMNEIKCAESTSKFSAAASSISFEQTVAAINGGMITAAGSEGSDRNANGVWRTQQVSVSGYRASRETVAFSSKGSVVTSDGRTIDFNITMEMSRTFAAAYEITGKETVYTDPLVINMDTDRAELDDVTFYFDLNGDGTEEKISALNPSSGFLALDKNRDGEINDGTELFGARTGNGFGELSEYDEDGNGWIDENDRIFNQLKVWVKCGTAEAELIPLEDADVGAIFLGSQKTNYGLEGAYGEAGDFGEDGSGEAGSGEAGAMVRRTGIYLKESGVAGTVQHVDFKI